MPDNEKQFEQDIEQFLLSSEGGYIKGDDNSFDKSKVVDIQTLVDFVKETQSKEWMRFERQCNSDPYQKFYYAFEDNVLSQGLIHVLRHGFKHRGIKFRVCYFKPESELNDLELKHYNQNKIQEIRQWHYSTKNNNSVDMMLDDVIGKTIEEACELSSLFMNMIKGNADEASLEKLDEAAALQNIAHMPARVKCAVLGWHTMEEMLKSGADGVVSAKGENQHENCATSENM